ncbi:hypothetical protein BU26DRAFT_587719 [Trematosphaeria pertusa]|uniref:Uncharacterized protein n=1 Tax=Trematosphaeria pertusa TaxID=390896 RepID=A0A6A6ISB8_9PLEO|nr:uncharacterized protein BU26DRAFT_587719 [Trematosphaeria pertusa]KAF2252988.1 hypothetical protein BU26DRAFT_587719 [Trematosphaeria pertusa]
MGKSASDANGTGEGKMFSENTVAVLLMAVGNTSISVSQYDMMSALDGNKTASSFQHQFRSVLKKARELKERVEGGEQFVAVAPSKKRGADAVDKGLTPPATPKKPKATPKPRAKKSKAKITEDDSPNNDLNDDVFASAFGNTVKKEADLDEEEISTGLPSPTDRTPGCCQGAIDQTTSSPAQNPRLISRSLHRDAKGIVIGVAGEKTDDGIAAARRQSGGVRINSFLPNKEGM